MGQFESVLCHLRTSVRLDATIYLVRWDYLQRLRFNRLWYIESVISSRDVEDYDSNCRNLGIFCLKERIDWPKQLNDEEAVGSYLLTFG